MTQSCSRKTKIAHLTSVHQPLDTRILHKECKTLADAGYEIVLIAPHVRDEVVDGIRIHSLPYPPNRLQRITKTTWQVFKAALNERADVYHFHDPELIAIGLLLKLSGKRVIYDVHEEVPKDILNKSYIRSKTLRKLIALLAGFSELFVAKIFDGIVTATPAIALPFPKDKTTIVQNFPILAEQALVQSDTYSSRPCLITYVGGITLDRGIKEMIHAVSLLPPKYNARLVLAGIIRPKELESEVAQLAGWNSVDFVGWQSREGVNGILGRARVGLVVLNPTPCYALSYPSKMFDYMSAGIPIVASDFPLWRNIIEEAGCGILVDPLDPQAIANAIVWLLEHPEEAEKMGVRGKEAATSCYSWEAEGQKLVALYERLLPSPVA